MSDKTVVSRVKRQRDLRLAEGWREVRVWVPTEADAIDVQNLAEERRARAAALYGLSEKVNTVSKENEERIAKAIAEHGSKAYNTPSGAVLELMTQLAEEDDLASFSRAFVILARAKPANASFVAGRVPAKISHFLVKHRGISGPAFMAWASKNEGWADTLKEAVRDTARFQTVVENMATEIKSVH